MAFTKADGQVVTLTATDVGLGNVTNESKATMFANPVFTGHPVNYGTTYEQATTFSGITGVLTMDTANASIFHVGGISSSITPDFTNVSLTGSNGARFTTVTVVVAQGATPISITSIRVNGSAQTISWIGGTSPSATANKWDIYQFTLHYNLAGTTQYALGSLATYG